MREREIKKNGTAPLYLRISIKQLPAKSRQIWNRLKPTKITRLLQNLRFDYQYLGSLLNRFQWF